jgi:hypothetical protein
MQKSELGWECAVPIEGFPQYRVDRHGNVYNSKKTLLKPYIEQNGYLRVSLSNETTKHKRFTIHRLVASAFVPNPDNFPQVNHINEDKKDNTVENLEWCSPLSNLTHSHVIEKASVAKERAVKCITTGEVYPSIKQATQAYMVHHSNIVACCNGRRKSCGGVKWEYVI